MPIYTRITNWLHDDTYFMLSSYSLQCFQNINRVMCLLNSVSIMYCVSCLTAGDGQAEVRAGQTL